MLREVMRALREAKRRAPTEPEADEARAPARGGRGAPAQLRFDVGGSCSTTDTREPTTSSHAWRAAGASLAPSSNEVPRALEPALAARLESVRGGHPLLHASLSALDVSQQTAVLAEDHGVLVRAPVGSGKTTVLVHRALLLHLVEGIPLGELAVLTFTNRAATEIRERIAALRGAPLTRREQRFIGTFHGVALSLLRRGLPAPGLDHRPDFAVLGEEERAALLDRLIAEHGLRIRHRARLDKRLRALSSGGEAGRDDLGKLPPLFAQAKRDANVMDFDDLIDHATVLLSAREADGRDTPRCLLVDEVQDCEPRDLRLLRGLRGPHTRFFAVGDPHQAIYGFRGSAPALFGQVAGDFGCRTVELAVSYRSTRTIVDGARVALGLQPESGGTLVAARAPGERIALSRHQDPVSEAIWLAARIRQLHGGGAPLREIAVLFRLRAQAPAIREALVAAGLACTAPDDDDEVKILQEGAGFDDGEGAGDEALAPGPRDEVRLLTLHAAKGLEFRHVFLVGLNRGVLPLGRRLDAEEEAEERRLLFVGLTRARDTVEVSYQARPFHPGAIGEMSPLLERLPAALLDWRSENDPPAPLAPPPAAEVETPVEAPAAAPPTALVEVAGFRRGDAVTHARYGAGVVVDLDDREIECEFGKLGKKRFPAVLCPLSKRA